MGLLFLLCFREEELLAEKKGHKKLPKNSTRKGKGIRISLSGDSYVGMFGRPSGNSLRKFQVGLVQVPWRGTLHAEMNEYGGRESIIGVLTFCVQGECVTYMHVHTCTCMYMYDTCMYMYVCTCMVHVWYVYALFCSL